VGARRNSNISKNWLDERKEILQKIKDQVRLYLGSESKGVKKYGDAYKKDILRPWSESNLIDLEISISQVEVVLGGDFHPFAQAQRTHLRILRSLIGKRKISIGLECLFNKDQEIVDDYLNNKMTQKQFLIKVNWQENWGFPWDYYKPFFDLAKKNGLRIFALNKEVKGRSGKSLKLRDQFAASIILEELKRNPEVLHYVLYGDLHIAEEHIPHYIKKTNKNIKMTTLYLNSEQIYFDLVEKNKEGLVEIVKFKEGQYCILSSPPWVKWQSYLMYLEENFDIDLEAEDDGWEFKMDHTDHVSNLVKMISAGLEINIKVDAIEVYSLKDPQFLKTIEKVINGKDRDLVLAMVNNDKCVYLPEKGLFYLSKSTVNHAAGLAGQYIHAQLSKRKRNMWNFPHDFIGQIWVEGMAFLLSKFVNPKRKAQSLNDLKIQLEAFHAEEKGREPLLLALDQKMSELLVIYANEKPNQTFQPVNKSSYIHAARFIGEILGERYFVLYQKQILDKNVIWDLLKEDFHKSDFTSFYYNQLKKLDLLEAEGIEQ
jgi:hypothetical protein